MEKKKEEKPCGHKEREMYAHNMSIVMWRLEEELKMCKKVRFSNKKNLAIIAVYVLMLFCFQFKMFFYMNEIGFVPDEGAHISYVIYMEENKNVIIPDFSEIKMYTVLDNTNPDKVLYEKTDVTCYLGHPPLYYRLMQLTQCVEVVDDGLAYVNVLRLKLTNIILMSISMLLVFYIGYSRICMYTNKLFPHVIYAAICSCIPMVAFGGSGVNNDNLLFLTFALFFLAILRYVEGKRDLTTYLLAAISINLVFLGKLTLGLIVLMTLFFLVLIELIETKRITIICNTNFWKTIPIYGISIIYYIIILTKYGSVQPSYQIVDPAGYYSSSFYVPEANRVSMAVGEYAVYFFSMFLKTWSAVYNGIFLWFKKEMSIEKIVIDIVLVCVLGALVINLVRWIRKKHNCYTGLYIALSLALLITIFVQYRNAYSGFIMNGYTGGYQARYYMCCIPAIAFLNLSCISRRLFSKKYMSSIIEIGSIVFSGLLIYSDFIYFLLAFSNY